MADRIDRQRLMWRCGLASAVLLAGVQLADAVGLLSIAQIYIVATDTATVVVAFDAANVGAPPTVAGPRQGRPGLRPAELKFLGTVAGSSANYTSHRMILQDFADRSPGAARLSRDRRTGSAPGTSMRLLARHVRSACARAPRP